MKTTEMRQKNPGELDQTLNEKLAKLTGLKFDLAGGKVKNLKEIRQTKLDIARIMTIQRETKKKI